jgi:NAD+ synthase (glutamine-hydrolysing)
VYGLARWRNAQKAVIPERCLTKAPTAELAPGQKDADQLPPYPVLDAILRRYIEGAESVATLSADFDAETVQRVAQMVRTSEYKRRQMPPGPKISSMLFSRDRRYPLTNGWKG